MKKSQATPSPADKRKDSRLLAKRALQVQRGAARAAVLGVNDGLVSVLCLVLAVAAAGGSAETVLLAGFAGLIAGAVSMAAGEWISVRSQVELFQGVLADLKKLVAHDRELLIEQLGDTFASIGYKSKTARTAANEVGEDDAHLSNSYASQVMGFNPTELGSPWIAAFSSFALFTIGALAPLLPWVFSSNTLAVWLSIIFTSIGSLIVGGYIASTSGKTIWKGSIRQFGVVVLASVVTYGIGYVFGVAVA